MKPCRILLTVVAILVTVSQLPASTPAAELSLGSFDRGVLRGLVYDVAAEHGVDPHLMDCLVRVESGYNPFAVSRKGAMGLMQLMPETARRLRVADPFDPEQNIRGGVREFARLVDRYTGNLALALAAYNAGEGAVQRYRGVPPYTETRNYVQRIMTLYTGRPYTLGIRRPARAPVRILRDPATGQSVITNESSSHMGGARRPATAGAPTLSGGFGAD